MAKYVDVFVLPIPRAHVDEYKAAAQQIAEVWKDHGALEYRECILEDFHLEGTRSFSEIAGVGEDEVVIFGWTSFASQESRLEANANVPKDPRMHDLVGRLTHPSKLIFDFRKMVFGNFESLF